jgi:FtsP/CotA-like multicopper oxidase with cupredoxin domain
LRVLNACNSRFLILGFSDPNVETWQVGTDGGYLRAPVRLREVLLAPAQRADLVVNFSRLAAGARVTLRNLGPDAPFRSAGESAPADPDTSGLVMEFRVDRRPQGPDPSTPPAQLVMPPIEALSGGTERPLALAEAMTPVEKGEEVPHQVALGTFDPAAGQPNGIAVKEWGDPVTENPSPGQTEVWAFYNFTGDAHPMHVHDVLFQLVDRQEIDDDTGRPEGRKRPPGPEEQGWMDTIIAYPGEVTRIRARFANAGQFVWHCHIIEHEDNEMMRPYRIGPEQTGEPQGRSKGHK